MKGTLRKRMLCILLACAMVLGYVPAPGFAAETDGLCEHHTHHTAECGYSPAVEGHACNHEHTDECYQSVTKCVHTHGDCGYVAAVEGHGCECAPDESSEIVHTEGCGYVEAVAEVPCDHVCSEESCCVTTALNCRHAHDNTCGYVEGKTESPCVFACEECAQEAAEKESAEKEAADQAAADAVAAQIEALPSLEEIQGMSMEAQLEAYNHVQAAYDAYDALTDEQKALIPNAEGTFAPLFAYFNSLTAPTDDVASGTCGENLTWVLTDDGVLSISGSGKMDSYYDNYAPWHDVRSDIVSVIINDGVTSIGFNAFLVCYNLTNVTISKSVENISYKAFSQCPALQQILVDADNTAYTSQNGILFSKDMTLLVRYPEAGNGESSFAIPESVTTLEWLSFSGCAHLTSITIPDSITEISYGAFSDCSGLTSILIPETVTSIGGLAFQTTKLSSIIIPKSVTSIGAGAFHYCKSLEEITFNGNAPEFAANAFSEVTATAYYPANNETWTEDVKQDYGGTITWTPYSTASEVANGTCGKNLTWVLTDDGTLTISGSGEMDDYSASDSPWYAYASQIETVIVGEGVTHIGNYAFYGCKKVAYAALPNSVTSIGNGAFEFCSLTDIALGTGITEIGTHAFAYNDFSSVTLPDSVRYIGNGAFTRCLSLTSIVIPEGVTEISDNTFANCIKLVSISLPSGIATIGSGAFRDCHALESIVLPNAVTAIKNNAFDNCSKLAAITIPDSVAEIGGGAFNFCPLTSVTIPASVNQIGSAVFAYCENLTEILVDASNQNYSSVDGALYNKNQTVLLECPAGRSGNFAISDSTITVEYLALGDCSKLTEITIPGSVTTIGALAFYKCSSIVNLEIPSSVVSIGYSAFSGCSSLSSITIPSGITVLEEKTFADCSSLREVTIPDSVSYIGTNAFTDCSSLTDVVIPDGVTCINMSTFSGCSGLKTVTIPKSVNQITWNAFAGCTSLAEVNFGGTQAQWNFMSIESAGNQAILNANVICAGDDSDTLIAEGICGDCLTWTLDAEATLTISGTGDMFPLENYNDAPWYVYRKKLKSVVIESGVTSVCEHAFEYSSLIELTVGKDITSINAYAFDWCESLMSITFEGDAPQIADRTFYNVTATAYYPANNETWTEEVKQNYGGTITWEPYTEKHVHSFDENNMCVCGAVGGSCGDDVIWIYADETLTISGTGSMHDYQYSNQPWGKYRKEIATAEIQSGVTSIGSYTFYNHPNLIALIVPESVTSLGQFALGDSKKLTVMFATETHPTESTSYAAASKCGNVKRYGITDSGFFYCVINNGTIVISKYLGEDTDTLAIPREIEGMPVKEIADTAYIGQKITKVIIPDGVTKINYWAFANCAELEWISIPNSVTEIDGYAFYNCKSLSEIDLPDNLTHISYNMFSGSGLTSIEIPACVQSIGRAAFSSTNLTSIIIPNGVKEIESMAFFDCDKLKSIIFEGDAPVIGYAFGNGANDYGQVTATAYYPSKNPTWTADKLKNYGGIITWEPYTSEHTHNFDENNMCECGATGGVCGENLTWVLTDVGKLIISGTGPMDDNCYWGGLQYEILTVILENGVTSIGKNAFNACRSLYEILIPDSVTSIGEHAFYLCSIDSILIPKNVTSIGAYAFGYDDDILKNDLDEICFTGDAPTFGTNVFSGVTATAYYPANNETWTEDVMQNYGGTITWIPYGGTEEDGLAITTQPVDYVGALNSNASFTVAVNREDVTYQWYFSTDGATWKKSSSTGFNTDTLTIKMTSARLGQRYRCEITDSDGNTVVSDAVTMMLPPSTIQIQTQPVDFYGAVGDASPFTVEATGEGLTYRWYYSTTGGETWALSYSSGCDTETLALVLRAYNSGRMYKCLITDANGNTEWTNAVTMALASGDIVIRTQPVSYTGAINDLSQFTTEAEGTNLTYQWYVSQDGGSTWAKTYNTGYNTPSLSVRLYSYRSGYQYKCVITSGNSVSVETDVATIAMRPITLKITEQPRNAGGPVGSNVTFHVGATGNGLSYQWQFSNNGGESWGNTSMTGGKTDTVTVPVTAARDGTQYRCVITDDSGTSQATNAAVLRVGAAPVITGHPESYNGPAGGTATFTVIVKGENLTYQWQYSNTGGSTWVNSGMTGATTASIDVKATTARNGQQYRCIVTNEYGSIISEPATLTIE